MVPKDKELKERPTHKTMLYLRESQWKALEALSAETDAPVSALVRRAIDMFLKGQK